MTTHTQTDAQWERVKDAVHRVLNAPEEQRLRLLDQICDGDAAMRREVESLVGVEPATQEHFLSSPLIHQLGQGQPSFGPMTGIATDALGEGQLFDQRFQLVRRLGEGGMGQVWLAEQIAPVRRPVALKFIKAGMYDESVVRRFLSERQSLAIMEHPAIAKVFDAGATPQGQPYLVMEYICGLPLTEYCDLHRFALRERLELFIQACEGVQHAHQKAIIHRDLKPPNILVIEVDGKPVPKIIDFGLAKTITPQVTEQTLLTRLGHVIGTPAYMSPEQVDPDIQDIDTRTDVYSLGVVLYELLTGMKPFEVAAPRKQSLGELLRRLREEEPPKPSAKVSANLTILTASIEARGSAAKQLVTSLRGDLDGITLKALERDRARRYGTPSDLAADIRRYLNDEPVLARPASAGYQLGKFIRRNRLATAAAAMVSLLAIVATVAGLLALKQRNLALMEQTAADRTARFMVSLFELADPGENRGNSVTVREVLDRGASEVDKSLTEQPGIRADLLTAMGQAYTGLGLYEPAEKLLETARTDQTGADIVAESRVHTLVASGTTLYLAANYEQAEKYLRQAADLARRKLSPADVLRSEALDGLADVLIQDEKYPQAEQLLQEALVADRKRGPDQGAVLARTLDSLGNLYFYSGDLPHAESTMREALTLHQRASGDRHPSTAQAISNLATELYQAGRYDEAAALYQQALPIYREVYGVEHPEYAALLINLGTSALMAGHVEKAEPLLRQALALEEKLLGPTHTDLVPPLNRLAMIDAYNGHASQAEAEIQRTEQIARLPNHGQLLDQVLVNVADLGLQDGRQTEQAAAALTESRRLLEAAFPLVQRPTEAWRYAIWDTVNAELLARQGDAAAAHSMITAAIPIIEQRFSAAGFHSLLAHRRAQWIERQLRHRSESGHLT